MAWLMLAKSVSHALDYDAKLVPSSELDSVSGPSCEAVTHAASELFVHRATEDEKQTLARPGCLGGFGLRK
eukprot:11963494-Karenia_brevis.AAC.1